MQINSLDAEPFPESIGSCLGFDLELEEETYLYF